MTVPQLSPAPELTEAEKATVARFDAAEEPEEVVVERVARAIYEADFDVDGCRWSWDDADWLVREDYRRMARAALDALPGDRGARVDEPAAAVETRSGFPGGPERQMWKFR